ncbi:BH2359 [Halalkalibacterium halodurans C-125]|uniref:BH2359 protein n=1 Tax=Halalkalibacterium halodurans (strain ATCC BAA-125 / DSM 18197 / FERM 7344 / JCM 9153 / C-125) TaxID=272558 RepID=Q9KAD0_HALH5|nr:BH2359 [Halalkalibacterium halodurans C-125]
MYQKFITHLVNKEYSKRTVEIIHDTMYAAMEKARVLQKIEQNPCRGAEITTKKNIKKRRTSI